MKEGGRTLASRLCCVEIHLADDARLPARQSSLSLVSAPLTSSQMGKGGLDSKAKPSKAELKAAKVGLLEKNGDLTKQMKLVLGEIFTRFDADGDDALSQAELEAFAVASKTGEGINEDEIKQLGTFFDTDPKGNLTRKGFEQMYLMQSNSQPDDTWRDLKALGYSKALDLLGITSPPRAEKPPNPSPTEAMNELREALSELKLAPEKASAHRRVGVCLQQLGRDEAAKREFDQAEELEKKAKEELDSTINELD